MTRIAACLIVRNSEATLERALDSIRPFVDEINVYDTGSTDSTLDLLQRLSERTEQAVCPACGRLGRWQRFYVDDDVYDDYGVECECEVETTKIPLAPIRVQQGEWRDDFAWAREQSFAMASDDCDWLLWLDDDDEIIGAPNLRPLAATAHPAVDGFIVFYDYARDENGACVCQLWRERLIRRTAGLQWRNAVHEVLTTDDRAPNFLTVPAEQLRYVHHRPAGRYSPDRNLEILLRAKQHAEAAGETPDPRTLAYLGTEYMAQGQWQEAAGYLQAYIDHADARWPDERMQVHHKLATCLRFLGNVHAALEVEFQALRERDDWAETAVGLAEGFATVGQWPRVERWARRALELGMPTSPLILNPLEFTFVPYVRLAEAAANQGRFVEAQQWLGKAHQVAPNHPLLAERSRLIAREQHTADTVEAVLRLRETLIRYDENLKALHLLEQAVPYFVAEHPAIVQARAAQRENCRHYLDPSEYQRWYAEEPKESTIGDDRVETIGDFIHRAAMTLELARQFEAEHGRKPRILDLGGNDMWLACYLWLHGGYRVDGVELNRQAVEKGRARMERFGAPGKLVQGDLHDAPELLSMGIGIPVKYDLVLLYEVFEHVPDTTRTLKVMESLVTPDGLVCLTTPNGAFEDGNLAYWHIVERKGHLRALPAHELAEMIDERGVIEEFIPHDGNRLTFVAYRPIEKKSKIVFYAGPGWEPWSPLSINQEGLGGSETALVQVAVRLARRGHRVKVYSGAEPGVYGGAQFRPASAWDPSEEADALIVSRIPAAFDAPVSARKRVLWCHDHSYPGQLTTERAARITDVVVLSDWQRERFERLYPFLTGKLRVVRNGITLEEDASGQSRYPHGDRPFGERAPRAVYSSSADRGLDVLLELWPEIRRLAPDAELHVFYGWDVFDRVAMVNPELAAFKQRVLELVEQAGGEDGGVFMRGRVGQRELAAEMQDARVWAYPTGFMETSCIGAMEARAAGLPIVTSGLAALNETVGRHGVLLPWGAEEEQPVNTFEEYRRRFVGEVANLLSVESYWLRQHAAARRGVPALDWERRVEEWEQLIAPRPARPERRRRARAAA